MSELHLVIKELNAREKVGIIEDAMKAFGNPIELNELNHYFAAGIYARELFIPAGVTLTGKIHKYSQLNIMTKGKLSVLIDEEIVLIEAPFVIVSPAGTKRIAYAHEDTIWITVHGTHETNLDRIEHTFIAQTEQEYLDFVADTKRQLQLPLGAKCLG